MRHSKSGRTAAINSFVAGVFVSIWGTSRDAKAKTIPSWSRENSIVVRSSVPGRYELLSHPNSSIVVNHLRQQRSEHDEQGVGIINIYLKYKEPDQSIDNIFASFLKQLTQECDPVHPSLTQMYQYHQDRNTSPSLSEILEALASVLEDYAQVYCVIDALDECHEELRWELLENLEQLQPKL